jgi:hypothetical protein
MLEDLTKQLHGLDGELAALEQRARAFCLAHSVILGGRVRLKSDGIEHAERLNSEWRQLVSVRDSLIVRRNVVLEKMCVLQGMTLPCNF